MFVLICLMNDRNLYDPVVKCHGKCIRRCNRSFYGSRFLVKIARLFACMTVGQTHMRPRIGRGNLGIKSSLKSTIGRERFDFYKLDSIIERESQLSSRRPDLVLSSTVPSIFACITSYWPSFQSSPNSLQCTRARPALLFNLVKHWLD